MAEQWDNLKDAALSAAKESLGELWREEGVPEFARAKTAQMAREKWLAETAEDPAERVVHQENLGDLRAHMKDEALKIVGRASDRAKDLLGTILHTVGGVLLNVAKSYLEKRLG